MSASFDYISLNCPFTYKSLDPLTNEPEKIVAIHNFIEFIHYGFIFVDDEIIHPITYDELILIFKEIFPYSINKNECADNFIYSNIYVNSYIPEDISLLLFPYCNEENKIKIYLNNEIDFDKKQFDDFYQSCSDLNKFKLLSGEPYHNICDDEIERIFQFVFRNKLYYYISIMITDNQHLYKDFYINNINKYPETLLNTLIHFTAYKNLYSKYMNIVFTNLKKENYIYFNYQIVEKIIVNKRINSFDNKHIYCDFDKIVNIAFINPTDVLTIFHKFNMSGEFLMRIGKYHNLLPEKSYKIHDKLDIDIIFNIVLSLYKDKNKIIKNRLQRRFQNGCKYSSDIIQKIKS
jgi:hypothetical protein